MRVLQLICPTGYYGAERWIMALASQLDVFNIDCDLAVTSENKDQEIELYDRFVSMPGNRYRLEMRGRLDIGVIFQLRKLIIEKNIEVVHTHGYKSDIIGLLAAKLARIKCVSTPHGYGKDLSRKMRFMFGIGSISLRFFDRVVPLSQALMVEIEGRGVPVHKLCLVENSLDLLEIDAALADKITTHDSENKIIGYVGRLAPGKRVDHIITAFHTLWCLNKSLQLHILGDGPELTNLQKQCNRLGCEDAVKFLGYVENRFVPMQQFDVFVMASISEGIPRSVMEALALKIPVAAYEIPGVKELVIHDETGLLAKSGDHKDLAKQISILVESNLKASNLGENGRKHIERGFSAVRMAEEYSAVYRSL